MRSVGLRQIQLRDIQYSHLVQKKTLADEIFLIMVIGVYFPFEIFGAVDAYEFEQLFRLCSVHSG